MMMFTNARTDEGMPSGVITDDPLAYGQGNLTSDDIVILEFLTDDFTAGIVSYQDSDVLSIFPNLVVEGKLSLLSLYGIRGIRIININGQVVDSFICEGNDVQLDIGDLNAGLYIISVQTDRGVINKKFIINH